MGSNTLAHKARPGCFSEWRSSKGTLDSETAKTPGAHHPLRQGEKLSCAGAGALRAAGGLSVREPRAPSSSVSGQQTQEGAIRSRKQVPESRLCHASAQLAATHRGPEEPSRSGRHLQCTREAKQTDEPTSSGSTLGAVSYVGRGF